MNKETWRPKIAVFDYLVIRGNPVGGCHLRMLAALCNEYDFTVFSHSFENPCPERITWVRIPIPKRPLALLFVAYHIVAPLVYWFYRWRTHIRFDLVQMVESNVLVGDVSYSHFCHRQYVGMSRGIYSIYSITRPRALAALADHWLHAVVEPLVYRRVGKVVVASLGLMRELSEMHRCDRSKITVIPNPVDCERMIAPLTFDRDEFRRGLEFSERDLVVVFAALGHFERKGLPLLMSAMAELCDPHLKLLVVGGSPRVVAEYRRLSKRIGLSDRVCMVGTRSDIRPYLWASDVFILPSAYEVFPLVALEAAGAGLPVIATELNGVEEFLKHGCNGFVTQRDSASIAEVLTRVSHLPPHVLSQMGLQAHRDVALYSTENFVQKWRDFYGSLPGLQAAA